MSTSSPFLELLAELRNKIAEYALYHGKHGIISPCPREYTEPHATLVAGHRYSSTFISSARAPGKSKKHVRINADSRRFLLKNTTSHRCTQDCLSPPPLTRTCRQLRNETLLLFYGVNHFHFELRQFTVLDSKGTGGFSVDDWLRFVEDTHLRCIPNFSMAMSLEKVRYLAPKTLQLTFTQGKGKAGDKAVIEKVCFDEHPTPQDNIIDCMLYTGRRSRMPFVAALKGIGLHLRALECLIASFELPEPCLLRDYGALQVGSRIVTTDRLDDGAVEDENEAEVDAALEKVLDYMVLLEMSAIGLLTLPPELRIMIIELAVYHDKTNGIISPRPGAWRRNHITLLNGRRFSKHQVAHAHVQMHDPTMPTELHMRVEECQDILAHENIDRHRCDERCLTQPALTRVCRQLRMEALPLFYGLYHFHFELQPFRTIDIYGVNLTTGLGDWLRAIGDTNLQLMKRFSMAAPSTTSSDLSKPVLQLLYTKHSGRRRGGKAVIHQSDQDYNETRPFRRGSMYNVYQMSRQLAIDLNRSPYLWRAPFVDALQHGLNVRALDCLIASFETSQGCWLRWYSALESPYLDGSIRPDDDYSEFLGLMVLKREGFETMRMARSRSFVDLDD
ncbi:hypothetical protein LTR95_000808 [Oleoguttula sp. CCFEE 5521]